MTFVLEFGQVSVELVLLLCFCIGFFLLRIHQQKKVFSGTHPQDSVNWSEGLGIAVAGGMKGTRRMQPDLAEGSRQRFFQPEIPSCSNPFFSIQFGGVA